MNPLSSRTSPIEKPVTFVVLPGAGGRAPVKELHRELEEEFSRHGSIRFLEFEETHSLRQRAQQTETMISELLDQGHRVVAVGHSRGSYVLLQMNWAKLKRRAKNALAFISLSSAPHANEVIQAYELAQESLRAKGKATGRLFPETLLNQYDFGKALPAVPVLAASVAADHLAGPQAWRRLEQGGHLRRNVWMRRIGRRKEALTHDLFVRHNWKKSAWRTELLGPSANS